MKTRRLIRFSLIVLFVILPGFWPLSLQRESALSADALSPEIEQQLLLVEALSRRSTDPRRPDPMLFGALVRLEEMLPRSPLTRRLQAQGKRLYIETLTKRTLSAANAWERMRAKLQQEIEKDRAYIHVVQELDRRLGVSPPSKAPQTSAEIHSASAHSLPFDKMRPGDIMLWDDRSGRPFVRFAVSLFAMRCTHSAIYLGSACSDPKDGRHTYEALNPMLGVRESVMNNNWLRPGLHVSLGHVNGISPAKAEQIVRQAVKLYGGDGRTPYHLWPPWDKTYYNGELYCSQLVWRIYALNGVDVDSNDWHFLAWFAVHNWQDPYAAPTAYYGVFPDEIKASPNITWYYDQVNPKQ